jgi:hypothetical protein
LGHRRPSRIHRPLHEGVAPNQGAGAISLNHITNGAIPSTNDRCQSGQQISTSYSNTTTRTPDDLHLRDLPDLERLVAQLGNLAVHVGSKLGDSDNAKNGQEGGGKGGSVPRKSPRSACRLPRTAEEKFNRQTPGLDRVPKDSPGCRLPRPSARRDDPPATAGEGTSLSPLAAWLRVPCKARRFAHPGPGGR